MNLIFHVKLFFFSLSRLFFLVRALACAICRTNFNFAFWHEPSSTTLFFISSKVSSCRDEIGFLIRYEGGFFVVVCFFWPLKSFSSLLFLTFLNCWHACVWCLSCYSSDTWLWYSTLFEYVEKLSRKKIRADLKKKKNANSSWIIGQHRNSLECAEVLSNKFFFFFLFSFSFHSNDKNFLLLELLFFALSFTSLFRHFM